MDDSQDAAKTDRFKRKRSSSPNQGAGPPQSFRGVVSSRQSPAEIAQEEINIRERYLTNAGHPLGYSETPQRPMPRPYVSPNWTPVEGPVGVSGVLLGRDDARLNFHHKLPPAPYPNYYYNSRPLAPPPPPNIGVSLGVNNARGLNQPPNDIRIIPNKPFSATTGTTLTSVNSTSTSSGFLGLRNVLPPTSGGRHGPAGGHGDHGEGRCHDGGSRGLLGLGDESAAADLVPSQTWRPVVASSHRENSSGHEQQSFQPQRVHTLLPSIFQ